MLFSEKVLEDAGTKEEEKNQAEERIPCVGRAGGEDCRLKDGVDMT